MRLLGVLLLALSNFSYSCDKKIPIEVAWEFDKRPTATEVGYLMILAPLKYEGWSLGRIQLHNGKNVIPIMKYVSEKEFPGKALFELSATSDFLKGARFTASYIPDSIEQADGTIVFMPCLHTQDIEVKI